MIFAFTVIDTAVKILTSWLSALVSVKEGSRSVCGGECRFLYAELVLNFILFAATILGDSKTEFLEVRI